jgi:hypothetical protein
MANLKTLYSRIREYAPNVPAVMMRSHLRDKLDEFCRETNAWKVTATITTTQGQQDYAITLPYSSRIYFVGDMRERGTDNFLYGASSVNNLTASGSGKPKAATDVADDEFMFWPTPDGAYTYDIELILIPTDDNEEIDDGVKADWGRYIALGAAGTLLAMPGQPWSNPQLVSYLNGKYQEGVDKARNKRNTGRMNADEVVCARPFI